MESEDTDSVSDHSFHEESGSEVEEDVIERAPFRAGDHCDGSNEACRMRTGCSL
jgi:hypothetical protein